MPASEPRRAPGVPALGAGAAGVEDALPPRGPPAPRHLVQRLGPHAAGEPGPEPTPSPSAAVEIAFFFAGIEIAG